MAPRLPLIVVLVDQHRLRLLGAVERVVVETQPRGNKVREILRQTGFIPLAIKRMLSTGNVFTQFAALSALEPIVFDESNWPLVIAAGLVPLLLSFIKDFPQSDEEVAITRKSVKLLSELAQDASCSDSLRTKNGITSIINLLLRSVDDETQESAMFALSHLSDQKVNTKSIIESGGLIAVIKHLGSANEVIQERAAWTTANLAADVSNHEYFMKNGLSAVSQLLLSQKDVIQSFSLKIILILSQNTTNHQKLRDLGILTRLKEMTHSSNRTVQLASGKAVALLS